MRVPRVYLLVFLFLFCGCGGGSNSNSRQTTPVKFDIAWAERSRAVGAPASALSAKLVMKGASSDHTDFSYSVDRMDAPAAYTQSVTSTGSAAVGVWNATITFYAGKGAQGDVVGVASRSVTLKSDGTGIGDVATVGTVASVLVVSGQVVFVAQPGSLAFSALDSAGNMLALSPGSAKWNLVGGGDILQLSPSGAVVGTMVGQATVTVMVDGKTSPVTSVAVQFSVASGPAVIAEAMSNAKGASIRIRWAARAFGTVAPQQIQLFRLPDFPASIGGGSGNGGGGGGGGGIGPANIPVAVGTPDLTEVDDHPSPFFPAASGVPLLMPGSNGCVSALFPPGIDTGFQPGMTYRYLLSAVGIKNASAACVQAEPTISGMATPIVPVPLTLPADKSMRVDLHQFAPAFTGRKGADLFQVEVSMDRSFKTPSRIFIQQIFSSSPNADGAAESVLPVDLTLRPELLADPVFANFVHHVAGAAVPTLYWRVGARNDADVPGPVHAISQDPRDPDRTFRWIYSGVFTFSPR